MTGDADETQDCVRYSLPISVFQSGLSQAPRLVGQALGLTFRVADPLDFKGLVFRFLVCVRFVWAAERKDRALDPILTFNPAVT
jgi:hypothetical protein